METANEAGIQETAIIIWDLSRRRKVTLALPCFKVFVTVCHYWSCESPLGITCFKQISTPDLHPPFKLFSANSSDWLGIFLAPTILYPTSCKNLTWAQRVPTSRPVKRPPFKGGSQSKPDPVHSVASKTFFLAWQHGPFCSPFFRAFHLGRSASVSSTSFSSLPSSTCVRFLGNPPVMTCEKRPSWSSLFTLHTSCRSEKIKPRQGVDLPILVRVAGEPGFKFRTSFIIHENSGKSFHRSGYLPSDTDTHLNNRTSICFSRLKNLS